MPLDISDPTIKEKLNNLKDNGTDGQWVQLGFVPKTEKIKITEEGSGLTDLVDGKFNKRRKKILICL